MMTVMATAERFNTTPVDVLRWPNSMFLDALEYIDLSAEYQDRFEEWEKARYGNRY